MVNTAASTRRVATTSAGDHICVVDANHAAVVNKATLQGIANPMGLLSFEVLENKSAVPGDQTELVREGPDHPRASSSNRPGGHARRRLGAEAFSWEALMHR